MRWSQKLGFVLLAAALTCSTPFAANGKQTDCTITVNSADEKDASRRYLPDAKHEFIERVECGRCL